MKRRLFCIISAAMLLSAAISSCEKDDEDQAIKTMTLIVSSDPGSVTFALAGSGIAVISWGDGSPFDTVTLSTMSAYRYRYFQNAIKNREIIIYGDDINSLYCSSQIITNLDVSNNTALTTLTCYTIGQLKSLDVRKNTALTTLNCSNNQLTRLDVSRNSALTTLNCYNNQLTGLDVSRNSALTYLNCDNNQLTVLDVRKNTALTVLNCGNPLKSLDVSKNTALEYLSINDSKIERLDVSRNTALKYLQCNRNQLSASALDALFGTLHRSTFLDKIIYVMGNPGTDACKPSIAREKGWTVRTD